MKQRPNIVLVMTDDQGYADLSCTGNPWLETPHIDAFSERAVRCNDFHVSPLCTPTRGALMTGRYPLRNGAWATAWGRSILKRSEVTMADVFRHNGYATGLFGKWHLGDTYPYRPQDRGFEKVVAHKGGGVGQTPDYWGNNYFDDTYFHNGEPKEHEGYCTDIWFEEAQAFIESVDDKPFFAYISTNAPHTPYFVESQFAERYRNNPDILEPEFYGMITNIDENFGKLESFLKDKHLLDNTILIFMTDNGSSGSAKLDKDGFEIAGYNAKLRGMKASYYEGGHRVPFFMHCPNLGLENKDIEPLLSHIDLLPTFIDLCRLELPKPIDFDGVSFTPCLTDNEALKSRNIFVQNNQRMAPPEKWNSAVLKDNWRLIYGRELYDLNTDPEQRHDLASQYPDKALELRQAHTKFWNEVAPELAEPCYHVLGDKAENPTRLDAMDVMGDIAWDQPHILDALKITGHWAVEVEEAGEFSVTLRRWPEELDLPIQDVPDTENFAINKRHGASGQHNAIKAKLAHLKVNGLRQSQALNDTDKEVTFKLELPVFRGKLEADFETDEGELQGAYYVYVERL